VVVEEDGGHGGGGRYKSEWRRRRWSRRLEGPRLGLRPPAPAAAAARREAGEEGKKAEVRSPAARVRGSPAMSKGGKAHKEQQQADLRKGEEGKVGNVDLTEWGEGDAERGRRPGER
jgi:hypothetical protein